jgi:hypothetical protein
MHGATQKFIIFEVSKISLEFIWSITVVIENIKWGVIAAAIWAGINQIAIVVTNTPLF